MCLPIVTYKLLGSIPLRRDIQNSATLYSIYNFTVIRNQTRGNKTMSHEKEKRIYINESQYFEGVTKEVWKNQIGGYQVCNKWLKDREKRLLSLDDIKHYCKIVTSLQKTIQVQKAIDDIYPEMEKKTIEIENR